jgi:hypothetical protein
MIFRLLDRVNTVGTQRFRRLATPEFDAGMSTAE